MNHNLEKNLQTVPASGQANSVINEMICLLQHLSLLNMTAVCWAGRVFRRPSTHLFTFSCEGQRWRRCDNKPQMKGARRMCSPPITRVVSL